MTFHRITATLKKGNRTLEAPPGSFTIDRETDDQAGLKLCNPDEAPKLSCIFASQNAILVDAAGKPAIIRLAAPADVQRMSGVMASGFIETSSQLRGQRFVNEELQAASGQGRPPGRPMGGWVRA